MADIFISYANEDEKQARLLAECLEAEGWSVWWDHTIPPGKKWADVIERELEAAECVVVLWSSHSVKSKWVKREAGEAEERDVLVPAVIEHAKIPLRFKDIQGADLVGWDGKSHSEFQLLLAAINGLVARTFKPADPNEKSSEAEPVAERRQDYVSALAGRIHRILKSRYSQWSLSVVGAVGVLLAVGLVIRGFIPAVDQSARDDAPAAVDETVSFEASNVGSEFAVQGRFAGNATVRSSEIRVSIIGGFIGMPEAPPAGPSTFVDAVRVSLARPISDEGAWETLRSSADHRLGLTIEEGNQITLAPFELSIPLSEGDGLSDSWLVFGIRTGEGYSHAHTRRTLLSPLQNLRPDRAGGEERLPSGPGAIGQLPVLPKHRPEELRIHYLNVGAGSCTLVECPGANAPPMLIDCGSLAATEGDMDRYATGAYMERILADHAPAPNLVLSHADNDHYTLIPRVLRDAQVQHIWLGGDPSDYSGGDRGDNKTSDFAYWLSQQVAGGAIVHSGFPVNWHNDGRSIGADLACGNASVSVMTANVEGSKNAQSLVLNIKFGDFGATFTGDAEGITESAASRNFGGAAKTTVLTASQHGARTHSSNSALWATSTAPEVMIYSAGHKFGHPQCEVVERFQSSLALAPRHPIHCGDSSEYRPMFLTDLAQYVTETNGTIVITSDGRSPLSLICTGSEGCEAQIAY